MVKKEKKGIIVCKNFHDIHVELLESFYSYMQTMSTGSISLNFILITETVSFIPDNIRNCCKLIQVSRPSRIQYNKCLNNKVKPQIVLHEIKNIKDIHSDIVKPIQPYEVICNNIYMSIVTHEGFAFNVLREQLYDILVYNLNIDTCIWLIIEKLINNNKIKQHDFTTILMKLYKFFKNYNNNYRPIYHLEKIAIDLMELVHSESCA